MTHNLLGVLHEPGGTSPRPAWHGHTVGVVLPQRQYTLASLLKQLSDQNIHRPLGPRAAPSYIRWVGSVSDLRGCSPTYSPPVSSATTSAGNSTNLSHPAPPRPHESVRTFT